MMILAYLLHTSLPWRGAEVRLKMVVPTEAAAAGVRRNLDQLVHSSRTGAGFEVILAGDRPFEEILRDSSGDADLVMMGIAEPGRTSPSTSPGCSAAPRAPTTLFVLAAEDLAFGEILFLREHAAAAREAAARAAASASPNLSHGL